MLRDDVLFLLANLAILVILLDLFSRLVAGV